MPRRSFRLALVGILTYALVVVVGLLAFGCASSTKTKTTGEPQRIRLVTYANPLEFELVNLSHTGRVEQYSTKRAQANRKVQSDDVMAGLIDWMDDNGFERLARPGPAPAAAQQGVAWALEIERKAGTAYILLSTSTPPEDAKQCVTLKNGFLELFNATYGLQAVESKPGELPFKTPDNTRKDRR